jgi:hypothetical protein
MPCHPVSIDGSLLDTEMESVDDEGTKFHPTREPVSLPSQDSQHGGYPGYDRAPVRETRVDGFEHSGPERQTGDWAFSLYTWAVGPPFCPALHALGLPGIEYCKRCRFPVV